MTKDGVLKEVLNKERLAVLRDLALVDDGENSFEMVYDRLTTIASKIVGAPVALMSMVASNYQFFKSYIGLPEPWKSQRRTPLSHSFCKHVVATHQPLIVKDAREIDFLKDNGAIPDLNVIGYLGVPVDIQMGDNRRTLGSFCVIDSEPREWSEYEIGIVTELAEIITSEIDLKAKSRVNGSYESKLRQLHDKVNKMLDELDTSQSQADVLTQIRTARTELNI